MNDHGGDEESSPPYFFLSYAHTPRAGARGAGDPNHWVRQLYRDLCEAVLQLTTVPAGVPVGFMDESMHQGELWAERLSEELATCRVFVPLYSPRYFNSVPCGQEWYSFTRRPVYPANFDSERTSGIVPVLWAPMSRYRLPEVASELQFNHASFGPDYATEGLYALMKLSYFRGAYELAVHRLARRIVEVAEETVIPVGRRLDFNSQPSAFNVTAPTKRLRISVLAYHRGDVPPERNPDYYGEKRTDWHPFRPAAPRPLAEHAVRLARQLGFQATVHEFDGEAEEIIAGGEPTAPGLLLLDRWVLKDERWRELVRRFDRADCGWVSVLEPWNMDDPDCAEQHREMGELSDQALRFTHRATRPSFLGATGGQPGLGSLEEFDDALPRAAMKAKYAFESRTRTEPEEPPPPRPNLRDAFRHGRGRDGPGLPAHDDHPREAGDRPDDGTPFGGGTT
ncbi:TIR-like protein FxsC [Kitasatospora sp. A2-31]|uniref:TIR-like protein FxsC n=1 Tax=Kitasatospora sp. A2-31 TaxID=2916414 RepID=UPI001EEA8AC9|nr:TIR-like protein FxsC [Kitasatospora sp. A2-31]MCG6495103.1 TIR-like protein FxsC [Kitasatospora sp. A2-31]